MVSKEMGYSFNKSKHFKQHPFRTMRRADLVLLIIQLFVLKRDRLIGVVFNKSRIIFKNFHDIVDKKKS